MSEKAQAEKAPQNFEAPQATAIQTQPAQQNTQQVVTAQGPQYAGFYNCSNCSLSDFKVSVTVAAIHTAVIAV